MNPLLLCALLALTDDEFQALPPVERDERTAAALRRFQTTRCFTSREWDFLVESWGEAMPQERQKRHAYCLTHRHAWVGLPMEGANVCRRCVAYKVENPA